MGNFSEAADDEPTLGDALSSNAGVIRRGELARHGVGDRALRSRLASGELVRVRHSVYRTASARSSPDVDLRIALAAHGPEYCGAHLSAAFQHGLLRYPPEDVHIARRATWGVRERTDGLAIHRFGDLESADVIEVDGTRLTTVERTLLDLAATATSERARRLLRFAVRAALSADDGLAARLERRLDARGVRRGSRLLRDAIGEWRETGSARSLVEVDFIGFCKEHGLPLPPTNVVVLGAERDAVWFDQRVIGELDTRQHHLNEVSFEDDRLRDGDATAAGWRVVRATPNGMTRHAARVAAHFRALLLPNG